MSANAWVRLKGYRRGAHGTILAVGYDLLAGLSEGEIQAVLAHEMGHAKFVSRGLKRWLYDGVARIGGVTGKLSTQVEAWRNAGKKFHVAEWLLQPSDGLTRFAARLLAAYSRQDEFEADRAGAQLFGAASMRSMLIKLELLSARLSRVPWTERVAQLEAEEGFSRWLVRELHISADKVASEIPTSAHDAYSTHPSLRDRIAALPPDDGRLPNAAPAIHLLSEPDRVAEKLIAEVHRVAAIEEQNDSKTLMRWTRKNGRAGTGQRKWVGIIFILTGLGLGAGFLTVDDVTTAAICVAFFGAIGAFFCIRTRHRDRVQLPVPRYAELKKAWQAEQSDDLAEQAKQIESELAQQIADKRRKKHKLSVLAEEGARALTHCDYLRAEVAGRLAIGLSNKNVEGVLIYMTGAAGLGLWDNFDQNFEFVRQKTALETTSTNWGSAWSLFLARDWARAEGLLLKTVEREPDNPTFLALLAITQVQRDKSLSAVLNATKAADLEPMDVEHAKLATRILLESGRLTEAASRLRAIERHASSDVEIAMLAVRLRLLRREYDAAHQAAAVAREADNRPHWLIYLGGVFEAARQDDSAAQYYREALSSGHYPEALLGLARLAATEGKADEARDHLVCALNLEKETAPKGRTAVELFHALVEQLVQLGEPQADCRAWIVTFPPTATPAALAERSLMLYATTRYAGETHLDFVLEAMQPDARRNSAKELQWRDAPPDKQPARPVREGIQFVM
jgi:predicted Zn-dependent protease